MLVNIAPDIIAACFEPFCALIGFLCADLVAENSIPGSTGRWPVGGRLPAVANFAAALSPQITQIFIDHADSAEPEPNLRQISLSVAIISARIRVDSCVFVVNHRITSFLGGSNGAGVPFPMNTNVNTHQSAIAVPIITIIIPATCGAPITAGRTMPDHDKNRPGR
jgi:hypothetical protein